MRKRSKYRPKGVIVDTMRHVITGMQRLDDADSRHHALTLRLKNHASLEAMFKGEGTRDDIDVLIASMNVAEALSASDSCSPVPRCSKCARAWRFTMHNLTLALWRSLSGRCRLWSAKYGPSGPDQSQQRKKKGPSAPFSFVHVRRVPAHRLDRFARQPVGVLSQALLGQDHALAVLGKLLAQ